MSSGFCVATTKKGCGSARLAPSTVTWPSAIASSRALWVLGVARLISSASSSCAKTGPGWKRNAPLSRSNTLTPTMSLGNRSEVNWMRRNDNPSVTASACARVVLPTPGTSSTSRWPPASRQVNAIRIARFLPTSTSLTWASAASSRCRGRLSASAAAAAAKFWSMPVSGCACLGECTLAGVAVARTWSRSGQRVTGFAQQSRQCDQGHPDQSRGIFAFDALEQADAGALGLEAAGAIEGTLDGQIAIDFGIGENAKDDAGVVQRGAGFAAAGIDHAQARVKINCISATCAQLLACILDVAGLVQNRFVVCSNLVGADHQRIEAVPGHGLGLGDGEPQGACVRRFAGQSGVVHLRRDLFEIDQQEIGRAHV